MQATRLTPLCHFTSMLAFISFSDRFLFSICYLCSFSFVLHANKSLMGLCHSHQPTCLLLPHQPLILPSSLSPCNFHLLFSLSSLLFLLTISSQRQLFVGSLNLSLSLCHGPPLLLLLLPLPPLLTVLSFDPSPFTLHPSPADAPLTPSLDSDIYSHVYREHSEDLTCSIDQPNKTHNNKVDHQRHPPLPPAFLPLVLLLYLVSLPLTLIFFLLSSLLLTIVHTTIKVRGASLW